MKQLMLATVASLALSLPAMAQTNNTNATQPNSQTQMNAPSQNQNMNQSQDQSAQDQNGNRQQARNEIDPSQLSHQQIRHIQTALDQKGFNVRHVDGKWGPRTEAAVKKFQQKQDIQGNGRLDRQTLAALGVDQSGRTRQGSQTTGAGSNESRMNQPVQNPGMTNPDQGSRSGATDNSAGSTSK